MADSLTIWGAFGPAASAGLRDVFNPFTMAAVLFYCFFVLIFVPTRKQAFYFSALFILSAFIFSVLELYGGMDHLTTWEEMGRFVGIFYCIAAAFFFIGGLVLLWDWKKLKQTQDIYALRWQFLKSLNSDFHPKGGKVLVLLKVIFFIFIGFFLTFLNSFWPKSEYLYVVFSNMISQGHKFFTFLTFLVYSIMAVALYLLGSVYFQSLYKIKNKKVAVSFLLISLSGLALSLSAGLIIVSLKILKAV